MRNTCIMYIWYENTTFKNNTLNSIFHIHISSITCKNSVQISEIKYERWYPNASSTFLLKINNSEIVLIHYSILSENIFTKIRYVFKACNWTEIINQKATLLSLKLLNWKNKWWIRILTEGGFYNLPLQSSK